MTDKDNGGPAFPFAATDPSNVPMQAPGMTLRDWFAGQALAGMVRRSDWTIHDIREVWDIADAMLEKRK